MEFKTIRGFENYLIGDNGEIYNKKHQRLKRPTSNHSGKGYLYVDLYHNGTRQRCYIHRLVAEHFIGNPENKPYVNHIDGNPQNNNKNNLEWCTALENVEHASKILGVMQQYNVANKNRQRAVKQIDVVTQKVVAVFDSIREAERQTGINSSYISQICRGKFKQCFGYSWCYVEGVEGK